MVVKSFGKFILEAFASMDTWTSKGSTLGTNPGGTYEAPDKGKHYVKFYHDPEQAKIEHATGKIYNLLGIHTPETKLISHQGKLGIASRWNDNLQKMRPVSAKTPEQAKQLGRMYHAAVITKNWDIVGLDHENIMHDTKTGDLHSLDHGGSMTFRAMGGRKEFDNGIGEKLSLRSAQNTAGPVFNKLFKAHPNLEKETAQSLKNLSHPVVQGILKDAGLANHKQLADTIMTRRDKHLASYE